MGCVTYLPRWLPVAWLSRRSLPRWFEQWLDLVPAAVLAALVAPALVVSGTPPRLDLARAEAWVALPTFWFAWKTRSLAGTVAVGMLLFWLCQRVFA